MADIRTLKLNLLADVDQFGRGIGQAETSTKNFEKRLGKFSKIATAQLLAVGTAAGYMAVRIGKDSIKAFIEDEKSQKKFAKSLENSTGATVDQINAAEDWISVQQTSYGIADDKLRPAFENLARATGDVGKAQDLTSLAMDVSAGTGKDLESVSTALSKAYLGNEGALTRLGIPLDDNIKKSGDFNLITDELQRLFGGAASTNAETYAGKLEILRTRNDELKERVGSFLMPVIMNLVDYSNKTLMPTLEKIADGFAGKKGSNEDSAYRFGEALSNVAEAFGKLWGALTSSDAVDGKSALDTLAAAFEAVATAINAIATAVDKLNKAWDKIPEGLRPYVTGALAPGLTIFKKTLGVRAAGGPVIGGQAYRVGEFGPETFVPSGSGSIRPASASGGNTFIFNGVVDGESARRSIEKLLQDSARRTNAVSLVGATL